MLWNITTLVAKGKEDTVNVKKELVIKVKETIALKNKKKKIKRIKNKTGRVCKKNDHDRRFLFV